MTEFASCDCKSFAHEYREQSKDERGKHEKDVGGNEAGLVLDARLSVGVTKTNRNDQSQQTDNLSGRRKKKWAVKSANEP